MVLSLTIINAHKSLEGHTRTEDYPGGKSRQGRRGQAWRMAVKSHLVLFSLVFPFYTKKTKHIHV